VIEYAFAQYVSGASHGYGNSGKIKGACILDIACYDGRHDRGSNGPKIAAGNSIKSEAAFVSNIP
jgi:hypothetical protein